MTDHQRTPHPGAGGRGGYPASVPTHPREPARPGPGTVTLGDGLRVPAQGLGAMVFTDAYGPADPARSLRTIHHAIDAGAGLLDTADVYGGGRNESLLADVLRTRRDEVVLATKFGILSGAGPGEPRAQGDPEHVRRSVDASLARLRVEAIDLYYYHRVDPRVDIEETVAALAGLVAAGKIRHVGLSEVTAAELERANAVHPIAAVQSEWSLFSRDVERLVLPTARRLGVGFVAYSPLGRGFLAGGVASAADLPAGDARRNFPRFGADEIAANTAPLRTLQDVAAAEGMTAAQAALAWLYASGRRMGVPVVPIPGTRRAERVDENLAAAAATLSHASLEALDSLAGQVAGDRNGDLLFVSLGRELRALHTRA
ncbi:MAG: aldo/keto reductase [Arthrobacter sp.]|uniref:aldo/keto reductase n=1 Tax=Arthrobacter sp. TaxID=1667 RepID=UPI003497607E